MKNSLLIMLFFVFSDLAIAKTTFKKPEAVEAVEAVVQQLTDAWNKHDMKSFSSLFTEDADFTNVIGMHWNGRKDIYLAHVKLHEGRMKHTRLTNDEIKVRPITEDVAVAVVRWNLKGDKGAPGWKDTDVRKGIFTHTLVKQGKEWKFTASQNTETVDVPNH